LNDNIDKDLISNIYNSGDVPETTWILENALSAWIVFIGD